MGCRFRADVLSFAPGTGLGRDVRAMSTNGLLGGCVRTLFALVMAASSVLLASCTAQPPVNEEEGTAAAGYGRLVGRIQFLHNGEPRAFGMTFLDAYYVTLLLRETGTDNVYFVESDREG